MDHNFDGLDLNRSVFLEVILLVFTCLLVGLSVHLDVVNNEIKKI